MDVQKPPRWQPPKEHAIALGQRETLLSNLREEYTAANNQLESFISTGIIDKSLEQTFRKELAHKQELIDELTLQIEELAKKHYATLLASLEERSLFKKLCQSYNLLNLKNYNYDTRTNNLK
jgi:hypothetical protein